MEFINVDKRFKISNILIRNFIFLLLFATMTTLPRVVKSFGFDSANSCTPNGKMPRRGRAQMIAAIPCDLTRQVYCHLPGSAYPWHAVRRFVHENQGLMKRMYGNVRHISVLRDEILNNDIDVEDVAQAAERYTKDGSVNRRASKFMHNREDFAGVIKNNDVLMEPHFRPVSTTSTTTTTTTVAAPISPTSTTAAALVNTDSSNVESTNSRPLQNNGNRGNFLNRRRITTTTTTRPETLAEKLNATTTTSSSTLRRTTTNFVAKIKDNKNNYMKNVENNEDSNESNEAANDAVHDDGNLASNSVYEIPTSPQTDVINGDNIEIIESPQLGLNNISSSSSSETSTISATLKVVTTGSAETAASPSSSPSSSLPATQRRPPLTNRQRPAHHYQQLLHKVNSTTILKESSNLKSKLNESERIPSTSSLSSTLVKGTTTNAAATATTTTATHKSNANKKNSNKNNYNNSPTESTTTTTTSLSSSHLSSLSAAFASATSSLASVSPLLPLKATSNIELLSGEKLQKQTVTAASSTTPAIAAATASTKPVVLRDGQLFQDTLKQEPTPSANTRGINACPVKEEVVAPFWANNTRGEILALLNLYPFEQYVHWEKCTNELKQMYCRDGCRCEQQYRLHRLLAYDPHNECRGIFSDWFRFPSCCICKCYNIPMEFRATSRSPRSERGDGGIEVIEDSRHPIEIAEEEVKKAIYEHATEEWYRPKDEFDFYEG